MSEAITAIHYLSGIRERLESLYEFLPDDPRLREHISDEVDWVDAEIERLRAQLSASADGKGAVRMCATSTEDLRDLADAIHSARELWADSIGTPHEPTYKLALEATLWNDKGGIAPALRELADRRDASSPPAAQADGKGAGEPVAWRWKYKHVEPDKWQYCEAPHMPPQGATINAQSLYAAPPSPPAAQMREALRHAQVRFECLADEFEKAGDTASWAMCRVDAGRMFKALSALPKPAVETEEGE